MAWKPREAPGQPSLPSKVSCLGTSAAQSANILQGCLLQWPRTISSAWNTLPSPPCSPNPVGSLAMAALIPLNLSGPQQLESHLGTGAVLFLATQNSVNTQVFIGSTLCQHPVPHPGDRELS